MFSPEEQKGGKIFFAKFKRGDLWQHLSKFIFLFWAPSKHNIAPHPPSHISLRDKNMPLIIHIDNICRKRILKNEKQTFGNDIKIRFLWRTAVVSSYVHKEWLRRAVALSKDRSETCFTQWVLPESQLSQWKSKNENWK